MKCPYEKPPPGRDEGAPVWFGGPLTHFHFNLKTRSRLVIAKLSKLLNERKTGGAWNLRASRNLDKWIIEIERLQRGRHE